MFKKVVDAFKQMMPGRSKQTLPVKNEPPALVEVGKAIVAVHTKLDVYQVVLTGTAYWSARFGLAVQTIDREVKEFISGAYPIEIAPGMFIPRDRVVLYESASEPYRARPQNMDEPAITIPPVA